MSETMRKVLLLTSLFLPFHACAQQIQAPFGRPGTPISAGDRVYAADQTSNTVSVIDPYNNQLLGVIRLGNPVSGALSPIYTGQLLVHGLGFSPDYKTVAVVSVASNSITLIDTQSNAVKGTVYVGRAPHEAFFTPDGSELWVTVRGEDYVSVIDPVAMKETQRIQVANGPGMTMFGPDGRYAFLCSSFTPELAVIDVASHQVVKRLPQASPFCPNIAVSPENDEVWFTLKDTGQVQIYSAQPPFDLKATLHTGSITNHVNFANNSNGKFAYVTIGGENVVKVYRRGPTAQLVATIPVGNLPHGIWPSGDGSRVYVALENDEMAVAIDTLTNKVMAKIPIGQTTQALVYVPKAVLSGSGAANLMPLGVSGITARLRLEAATSSLPNAQASVAVNSLGQLDLLQVAAEHLMPKSQYQLGLTESGDGSGKLEPLAVFTTQPDGSAIVQAIGPLKKLAAEAGTSASESLRQFLIVTPANNPSQIVLRQSKSSTSHTKNLKLSGSDQERPQSDLTRRSCPKSLD
jgi:YVTN family beta-propeller protein